MSCCEAMIILRNNFRTEWRQRQDIGTEEDSIHQLDRVAQVTIFRLRTGHCQLLSHLHRPKISHSDKCPCGTGPQTPNHIVQSCPTFDALRHQTWPSPVEAHRKLWGPVEILRYTADFALLTGLKIQHGREHRRRRRRSGSVYFEVISDCCREISITLNGFSCCCFRDMQVPCLNLKRKCTPLRDNCEHGTLLWYLLLLGKLSLPDISYYLSHGRYLIHCLTYLITCHMGGISFTA